MRPFAGERGEPAGQGELDDSNLELWDVEHESALFREVFGKTLMVQRCALTLSALGFHSGSGEPS